MTFDEAFEQVEDSIDYCDDNAFDKWCELLNDLRKEYAPTVEMTKAQRDLILRNQDEDRLYEILGDGDGYYFNADYWSRLEPHEVAQAYLHPETIKIVDE